VEGKKAGRVEGRKERRKEGRRERREGEREEGMKTQGYVKGIPEATERALNG
jgi:hypothetical protein